MLRWGVLGFLRLLPEVFLRALPGLSTEAWYSRQSRIRQKQRGHLNAQKCSGQTCTVQDGDCQSQAVACEKTGHASQHNPVCDHSRENLRPLNLDASEGVYLPPVWFWAGDPNPHHGLIPPLDMTREEWERLGGDSMPLSAVQQWIKRDGLSPLNDAQKHWRNRKLNEYAGLSVLTHRGVPFGRKYRSSPSPAARSSGLRS